MNKIIHTKLSYILEIPQIADEGFLCFAESKKSIPFVIKRFYYISEVVKNAVRGKHAHKQTLQMLFCIKGSITIVLDNGKQQEKVRLSKPNQGVFLNKMMWHEMKDFQEDTVLLVLASDFYNEEDYIRSYTHFQELIKNPVLNFPPSGILIKEYKKIAAWFTPIFSKRFSIR